MRWDQFGVEFIEQNGGGPGVRLMAAGPRFGLAEHVRGIERSTWRVSLKQLIDVRRVIEPNQSMIERAELDEHYDEDRFPGLQ